MESVLQISDIDIVWMAKSGMLLMSKRSILCTVLSCHARRVCTGIGPTVSGSSASIVRKAFKLDMQLSQDSLTSNSRSFMLNDLSNDRDHKCSMLTGVIDESM